VSLLQIALALDQLANTVAGGYADESLSARSWRLRERSPGWARARRYIDRLFWLQPNHCFEAYESERLKRQLPPEYRTE